MAIDILRREYLCPGEKHPISRSVHLARLAASFAACNECQFRFDARRCTDKTGIAATIAGPPARGQQSPVAPLPGRPRDVFTTEGVRGVFRNEVTRALAARAASAFSIMLWEESSVSGRNDGIDRGARQIRPTVIVGYDERPSSPSLFAAAVAALRRMGCHVVDIGLSTKTCLWFAVEHLHASGGVYVTGSGGDSSWTGIDFLRRGARPVSLGTGLERIRELMQSPLSRPTRSAGTHIVFQATAPYEASLGKHFPTCRSRKIAYACASPLVRRTVERVAGNGDRQLVSVELPVRVRDPAWRRDADVLRLSRAVRESQADFGILIDDDGQRCGFVDERGRHISPAAVARLIILPVLARRPGCTVLLEPTGLAEMRTLIEAVGGRCQPCPETFGQIAVALGQTGALYAGGDSGRHWFADEFPMNDALITFAKVLAASSQAGVRLSELATG